MDTGRRERGRPPVISKIALGLVICGLLLGGLWALTLIGLMVRVLARVIL